MKKMSILIMSVALISLVACKERNGHDHHNMDMKIQTKVVEKDGYRFIFDFMDMESHMDMMKQMKMEMKDHAAASHVLTFTIVEVLTSKQIKDAKISFKITKDDKEISAPEALTMSGNAMSHYIALIDLKGKGNITITADVKTGSKTISISQDFDYTSQPQH